MKGAAGAALACCAFSLFFACAEPPQQAKRDFVLLLTVDTLRPDYLSSNGYDRPTSPFLDALMSRGLVFDSAITPIARTTPALASMLTGQYPSTHGVRTLLHDLKNTATLADAARQAGFTTLAVVSNHILAPARGLGRGFDVYDFAGDRRNAAATTRAALDLLADHAQSERILLWVHYIDPHVPYAPPERYARNFDAGYTGPYGLRFGDGLIGESAYPKDLGKRAAVHENALPDAVNAHVRRLYAADIRATDDAIADLLQGLEAAHNDWLVLFTADHGEALGERPNYFYDHGDYVLQSELRVPFAIVLPESDPLARSEHSSVPVSLIDVAPTLAELLDLSFSSEVAGRSLVPILRGEDLPMRPLFAESGHAFQPEDVDRRVHFGIEGRFRAVVEDGWKLVFTPGLPADEAFELYDLTTDPLERANVFRQDHPRVLPLQKALAGWLKQSRDAAPKPSPQDLERLRSLGYVE